MNYIYKITLIQQILLLKQLIITNGILIALYLFYFGVSLPTYLFLFVFAFQLIKDIIPTLIVHFQYLYKNWGAVFIIDTQNQTVSYKSPVLDIKKRISEITKLQRFSSYGSGSGWYSFGYYRYYKITFNDGNKVIITCLMMNKMEKTFNDLINIELEKEVIWLGLISNRLEE